MKKFEVLSIYLLFNLTHLKLKSGSSLVVQWLGLRAFTAESLGSIPGWGTKIPQAVWHARIPQIIIVKSVLFSLTCSSSIVLTCFVFFFAGSKWTYIGK